MEHKAKLLIVESDAAEREQLCAMLLAEDHELYLAATGEEAMELIAQLQPDVMVLAAELPRLGGHEVCQWVRQQPDIAEVPILLICGADNAAQRLAGLASGADELVSRPVDAAELRLRIRTIAQLNRFRKLLAERSRYERLFTSSPDGIFIINPGGEVLMANEEAARILQVPFADRVQGVNLCELVSDAGRPAFAELLQRTWSNPEASHRLEVELVTPAGKARIVQFSPAAIEWGGATALQLIARDFTETRRLEEQYRQSQKMEAVGRLVAGVAHDFRNVLGIINGYSSLLLSGLEAEDPQRRGLEAIADAGERAAQITSQLLLYSRKQGPGMRELDLGELLHGLTPFLQRVLGERVMLEVQVTGTVSPVMGDPAQLEQALVNLAVNARDAMPRGGTLTITVHNEAPGQFVLVQVQDTGAGMDAATRARMFEPFFTTKDQGGTGLGLANVQRTLKEHGAHVYVKSAPGQGTSVSIYVPVLASAGTTAIPARRHELVQLLTPDPVLQAYLADVLQAHGYRTQAAATVDAALPQVQAEQARLKLVLVDSVLAEEYNRAARELPLEVPVLALCASGELPIPPNSDAKWYWLTSPLSPGKLLRTIRAISI